MSEMIDRVAKELAYLVAVRLRPSQRDEMTWEAWAETRWRDYRGSAAEVIGAMRVPTDAMIEEGKPEDGAETARAVWSLMINAALAD